jgi:hypothetical protein
VPRMPDERPRPRLGDDQRSGPRNRLLKACPPWPCVSIAAPRPFRVTSRRFSR